jgi:ATP-binding cassette, subfamily B, bacterial
MYKQVYKQLLQSYGKQPGYWFGVAAELYRTYITRFGIVIVMGHVTADLWRGDLPAAKSAVLILGLLMFSATFVEFIGTLWAENVTQKEYARLGQKYYRKLINKDMSFYRDNQTGYLIASYRHYLDGLVLLSRFIRVNMFREISSILITLILMAQINMKLTLIMIVILVLQLAYISWSSKKANIYREKSHILYKQMTAEISDQITNIVAFRSSGKTLQVDKRIARDIKKESEMFSKRRTITAWLTLPRSIVTALGMTVGFYVYIDAQDAINAEVIGSFVVVISVLFQYIRVVMEIPSLLYEHDDLVLRIEPTLDYMQSTYEKIVDSKNTAMLDRTQFATIIFNNICFGYGKSKILDNFSLTINAGERVGIVGLSGAGKSTLANLLLRFDEVDQGEILINGVDIRKFAQNELHNAIAYVPQEPLLFHKTVRENIVYFGDNNENEILRVAKIAHAHEFIKDLPQGYDTLVGERGIKLSGGQKQRIAIARALLKNAPIVLFDEATSALDSESEAIIQAALPEVVGKKTAIVIAHRLSTIADMDRIIVMHQGKIVEQGTHKELIGKKGRYSKLWQQQSKVHNL